MPYTVEINGLASDVAHAAVNPKHASLMSAIRRHAPVANAQLVTHRGDAWLSQRKVVSADGALVAEDHAAWLAAELERDGGRAASTMQRLRALDYRLTECAIDTLYIVHDRATQRQDDFVQIEVLVEEEVIDRRLFAEQGGWGAPPKDLRELVSSAEEGERFRDDQRVRHRPVAYRLRRAFDAGAFLREAVAVETAGRSAQRARVVAVSGDGGPPRRVTLGDLAEDTGPFVWRGQRLIEDWTLSSAGRAGRRFCASWTLQISDYTSPQGERSMGVVPLWTHTRKMAAIERNPKSAYELYGKLESLDRRVGVPFGWYFYMLHGNLVHCWAGQRVLEAAEGGKIFMPEHDYQILKRWSENSYGF